MNLHHVLVCCPPGGEDAARAFYAGALGMVEVDKPPVLAARGGAWFRSADGTAEVHVGVEADFRPARKAHPAFVVGPEVGGPEGVEGVEGGASVDGIDAVAARLVAAGFPVEWDGLFPGYRRFYTADGNGNRVEILSPRAPS